MSFRFRVLRPSLAPALLLSSLALLPLSAQAQRPARAPRLTPANSALYIANIGDGSVLRCNAKTGKVINVLGLTQGLTPIGLAIGPDRNLYVTDIVRDRIMRFNPATGASLGAFVPARSGGLTGPITLAFGPDHNLYVVTGGGRPDGDIRRFNGRTGAPMGVFVPHGRGGLVNPGDVTFGPDHNLYVTNNAGNQVLRFNGRTGAPLGAFVKAGSGGLRDPQNIAFGPAGDLYVGGPSGVLQFSRTGAFVRVFVPRGTHLSNVGGLAFGPDGDLYVGDWQRNDVVRFDGRTAAFKSVFVSPGSGLIANRYILFGPRGGGGLSPQMAQAARVKRMQDMRRVVQAPTQAPRPDALAEGTAAPDFTVQDKDGKPVKLSDYKGKVVVLDFWATWCGPCQQALPHTNQVAKLFAGKGVVTLAVNVWDNKAAFDAWLPQHPEYDAITFALDPTQEHGKDVATLLYRVHLIPTQFVIGKDGRIFKSIVGYSGTTGDLADAITAASAAKSASAR